jgi:hypothetical protein
MYSQDGLDRVFGTVLFVIPKFSFIFLGKKLFFDNCIGREIKKGLGSPNAHAFANYKQQSYFSKIVK